MTSIRVRATSRSWCVVILALASSPGTTTTRPPIASTSDASSVPSRSSSWARRNMPAAKACGVCTATRRSRSSVSATCPSSTTLTVSTSGMPGTAPSAPARTALITSWNNVTDASGRAASWTTTTSASWGTAAKPARTEATRVSPPATMASTPCSDSPARSGGTTSTTPSATARARSSAQSRTRRSPRCSYCLSVPNRTPAPAATTTAQTDMPVLLLLGRRDLALGGFGWVQTGEEHAPHRRLYVRGDTRRDLSAYEMGSARDDDHRAVVEEPDALPGLAAGAAHREGHDLAGHVHRAHALGQAVQVQHADALQLGDPLQIEVGGEEADVEAPGERNELCVHFVELGDLVVDDVQADAWVTLQAVEDLEASAAAATARRVCGVGDALELVEHEPGNEERSPQKTRRCHRPETTVDRRAAVDEQGVGSDVAAVAGRPHERARRKTRHRQQLLALAGADPEALIQPDPHQESQNGPSGQTGHEDNGRNTEQEGKTTQQGGTEPAAEQLGGRRAFDSGLDP